MIFSKKFGRRFRHSQMNNGLKKFFKFVLFIRDSGSNNTMQGGNCCFAMMVNSLAMYQAEFENE